MIVVKQLREERSKGPLKLGYSTPEEFIIDNFNDIEKYPDVADLCEVLKASREAVYQWAKILGVKPKRPLGAKAAIKRNDVRNKEVVAYIKSPDPHSVKEAAEHFKVSQTTIYNIWHGRRKEHGIT